MWLHDKIYSLQSCRTDEISRPGDRVARPVPLERPVANVSFVQRMAYTATILNTCSTSVSAEHGEHGVQNSMSPGLNSRTNQKVLLLPPDLPYRKLNSQCTCIYCCTASHLHSWAFHTAFQNNRPKMAFFRPKRRKQAFIGRQNKRPSSAVLLPDAVARWRGRRALLQSYYCYLFTFLLVYIVLILDCVGYFHRPQKNPNTVPLHTYQRMFFASAIAATEKRY